MPPSKNLNFHELSKYFHLPISQVAKQVGVCATILKKICRKNGIARWPHRKIRSLDRAIANLEMNISRNPFDQNPEEREEILREIELLKEKRLQIVKNPNIIVKKKVMSTEIGPLHSKIIHGSKASVPYPGGAFKTFDLPAHDDENNHQPSSSSAPSLHDNGFHEFSNGANQHQQLHRISTESPFKAVNEGLTAIQFQHPPKFTIPHSSQFFHAESHVQSNSISMDLPSHSSNGTSNGIHGNESPPFSAPHFDVPHFSSELDNRQLPILEPTAPLFNLHSLPNLQSDLEQQFKFKPVTASEWLNAEERVRTHGRRMEANPELSMLLLR